MGTPAPILTLLHAAVDDGRRAVRRNKTKILTVLVTATMVGATLLGSFDPARPADGGAQASHLPGDVCEGSGDTHVYDVVALATKVVYNHWGDHDPKGRLFVLEQNKQALLDQVAANPDDTAPLAQPLVVRAHLGDCVVFNVTNELTEDVSFHVHGVVTQPGQGLDLGTNGPDVVPPGQTRTYKARIPADPAHEGAHFLHSHDRFQQRHGMFGALVAEPPGTSWFAQNGSAMDSGIEAMIVDPNGPDFREYLIIYHDEIGEGPEGLFQKDGQQMPQVSPFGEYGPGTKGINLRSEPFMTRFEFHDDLFNDGVLPRGHDKSQGYGSYTYGDPAAFFAEAYVGDPTKMRLMNAGPGQTHVHHLHGGGIRWRHSPVSDDTQFDAGLVKVNPVNRSTSERIDVQSLGPGEAFNAVIEGGAGGVQQTVGDLLIHCHIVEHYVSGMWTFWRVYNTAQADLAELPDRGGTVPDAVNSTGLLGTTLPDGTVLDETNIDAWVQDQLPARGVAEDNDASVWDWEVQDTDDGPLYLGEPESGIDFPNFPLDDPDHLEPGERPELLFNPDNGKLAYPTLRPHFGERPPFAAEHGGAPYLGDEVSDRRPDGLCVPGSRQLDYDIVALATSVPYNAEDVDTNGQIFVHAEDKADILAGSKEAKSLVVRGNQGDCIDVTLTSQLESDSGDCDHDCPVETGSKVNMHIHLVQFDIQASDGVITGFNYEQSVRPAAEATTPDGDANAATVTTVTSQTAVAGQTILGVDSTAPFLDANGEPKLESNVGVGLTQPGIEQAHLVAVDTVAGTITLDAELAADHTGQLVGYEFVNYRWYPDVELGMVYWHDHVDGMISWRHGLFGALVVEPAGSRWCDPQRNTTGPCDPADEVLEGHVVDIVNEDPAKQDDKSFTFREYVAQVQENGGDEGDWASINLRNAPFDLRSDGNPLSSADNGDPATDLWQAYPGDPFKVRLLYAGQGDEDTECDGFCLATSRGVSTFAVTGHKFPHEQYNPGSRFIDRESFGISDQKNWHVDCAGGGTVATTGECARQAGDYLYGLTTPDFMRRGAWGVLRVHASEQSCTGDGDGGGGAPAKVFVNEFDQDPDRDDDWAELWNNEDVAVNLTGWELRSLADGDTISLSGTIQPGEFLVFDQSRWLDSRDETIELYDDQGNLVDATATLSDSDDTDDSWQRTPDGSDTWEFRARTKGATNGDGGGGTTADCLQVLPSNTNISTADLPTGPVRHYDVTAKSVEIDFNAGEFISETRAIFEVSEDGGAANPEPMVLRALPGETVEINLTNDLSDPVTIHPSMLICDPADSYGIPVGNNPKASIEVAPGATATFRCFADREVTGWLRSYGTGTSPRAGFDDDDRGGSGDSGGETSLYGAIVVEPEGSTFTPATGTTSTVNLTDGTSWTEQVLLYENEDNVLHSSKMPYVEFPVGIVAVNYRTEPLTERDSSLDPDQPMDLSLYSSAVHGDPETPIIEVAKGGNLVVRAIGGAGDQHHIHQVNGHWWARDPDMAGSNVQDFAVLGPGQTSDAWIADMGQGGAGDYLYGNHRLAMNHAGQWGILRVG